MKIIKMIKNEDASASGLYKSIMDAAYPILRQYGKPGARPKGTIEVARYTMYRHSYIADTDYTLRTGTKYINIDIDLPDKEDGYVVPGNNYLAEDVENALSKIADIKWVTVVVTYKRRRPILRVTIVPAK